MFIQVNDNPVTVVNTDRIDVITKDEKRLFGDSEYSCLLSSGVWIVMDEKGYKLLKDWVNYKNYKNCSNV